MALMNAKTFLALRAAEKKRDAKQPLSQEDEAILLEYASLTQKKLCGCGCGDELEPRVDGERHRVDGKEINSSCYFAAFGDLIEKHPILSPRLRRRR